MERFGRVNGHGAASRFSRAILNQLKVGVVSPGDDGDIEARYIEAAVSGVLAGCLYLPNGNPQPGPMFDYKLAWFERLNRYERTLIDSGHPIVLAGDNNVVPPDLDIYNAESKSWKDGAPMQPEKPRLLYKYRKAGMDGCRANDVSRRAHLHVLGLPLTASRHRLRTPY